MHRWLLINDVDPAGQLKWLADTLQEAEDNGEKVLYCCTAHKYVYSNVHT